MVKPRQKLIEVALPLDAINFASAREKSIRHGHPSTLHLWWARRPLAAARAVIFSQMVDDPGSVPEEFPTEKDQEVERQRLFRLIEELVQWENMTNEEVLERARAEIRISWARWCLESGENPGKLPPFHDPFAGGGALPLEAQRLGLEAHASDLNPVAVMINKAMIEIPPQFANQPPINPEARQKLAGSTGSWRRASGLAEDVRYYGNWMMNEAKRRIGHLYPPITLSDGGNAKAIAWLWARTVESPNPGYRGCYTPLVTSFWLSTKPGKLAWVEPVIDGKNYRFEVRTGIPPDEKSIDAGTKLGRGANFRCLLSDSPLSPEYIRTEAQAGRMKACLLAIVGDGDGGRIFTNSNLEDERIAKDAKPKWKPDELVPTPCHDVDRLPMYGMFTWGDAFTNRQLVALTTFSDLVAEVRDTIISDAVFAKLPHDNKQLNKRSDGTIAYADAVRVYLTFTVDKCVDYWSSIATWVPGGDFIRSTFGRQAIPMVWDYAECNPFSGSTGSFEAMLEWVARSIEHLPAVLPGFAYQADASLLKRENSAVISSDPPYYDNIGYADLSDFFYVWMRRILRSTFPDLFGTMVVPKERELIAAPHRHGGNRAAEEFFIKGMTQALSKLSENAHPAFPVTIYYAFKQSETKAGETSSTGWETFLQAVFDAGFSLSGTWPMRTERPGKITASTNILASSIILVCRPRSDTAPITTRKDFLVALRKELPLALRHLQEGNIAPVDLAQASIGPGMGIFSRYSKVLEADGESMKVRAALAEINKSLDEVLAEQDNDFDVETRWALAWFESYGFNDGPFGEAETLSVAKNTAVNGLVAAGLVVARAGKVRLFKIDELSEEWNPLDDNRLTVWEMTHHLIKTLTASESAASELLVKLGSAGEVARELAYRLYNICERRKRPQEAQAYNDLVLRWPELQRLAQSIRQSTPAQGQLI